MSGAVPTHVGIIMDGNGRWAQSRGQIRTQGHLEGLKAAKRVVKAASDLGISYLTLYTFSTENWKRTAEEVGFIMGLVKQYLRGELAFYKENRIRIRHTGDKDSLPPDIQKELASACDDTKGFTGLQVILALNYGGRDEISRAVNRALAAGASKTITPEIIGQYLDNPDVPDPDLIIRTAGEFRTSNFLLWEGAYAEYYISPKFWPDWDSSDLSEALENYENRERRFGGVAKGVVIT
ncbi:polyprenyl diphosphate synthase [Leadbettera azotonutricia]|uniref:Isoprenyl transferase n=1 Tax=Leadbettera azotonutricia (strain ATCC BAA-888 / DSM 13862 / ZAS-9) TaxID=545695 RepID=F5YB09_LEAAZ|nr:polyprenyl diphosphate synthase [Leadbettera azotonutricia]AEF81156.1 di-trans,poly-cis-decaprenylcistransferase [Leadbettera azotonutricia ZAS-9]